MEEEDERGWEKCLLYIHLLLGMTVQRNLLFIYLVAYVVQRNLLHVCIYMYLVV